MICLNLRVTSSVCRSLDVLVTSVTSKSSDIFWCEVLDLWTERPRMRWLQCDPVRGSIHPVFCWQWIIKMASFSMSSLDVSIDDIMHSMIASRDNSSVTCACKSTCSTRKCPCKGIQQECNVACKCGKKKTCKNGKTVVRTNRFLFSNRPWPTLCIISM